MGLDFFLRWQLITDRTEVFDRACVGLPALTILVASFFKSLSLTLAKTIAGLKRQRYKHSL